MIEKLRRNPPKVTRQHWDQAGELLKRDKEIKDEKDRDIRREIKDFSKDLSGFVYNRIKGVGEIFNGFGEGRAKEIKCSFCEQHESIMHHMKDSKWYCPAHKWFGDLTEEQKQKELENVNQQNRQESNSNV